MSMVGLDVFVMMLNCVTNPNAKFVLCGDMYQLPSISKGCVFSDLIESHKVPTAELTKVFRYDTSFGAFVGENGFVGKDVKAVGKAFGNVKHVLFFGIKNYAVIFSKTCTTLAQVNGNIVNLSLQSTNKLPLWMLGLKVQASKNTF